MAYQHKCVNVLSQAKKTPPSGNKAIQRFSKLIHRLTGILLDFNQYWL